MHALRDEPRVLVAEDGGGEELVTRTELRKLATDDDKGLLGRLDRAEGARLKVGGVRLDVVTERVLQRGAVAVARAQAVGHEQGRERPGRLLALPFERVDVAARA